MSNQFYTYNSMTATNATTGYTYFPTLTTVYDQVATLEYDDHDVMKLLTVDPYSYPPDPDPRQAGRHGATLPHLAVVKPSGSHFCICDCEACVDEQETCICKKCGCSGLEHPREAESYALKYKNLRKL